MRTIIGNVVYGWVRCPTTQRKGDELPLPLNKLTLADDSCINEVMSTRAFSERLSGSSLALAFWVEGPALLILVWMLSFGFMLVAKNYGYAPNNEPLVYVSLQLVGMLLVTAYIWIVSRNATPFWAYLARFTYVAHCALYVAVVFSLFGGANGSG